MFRLINVTLCLSLVIVNANTDYGSFIDPCKWDDADCILKSAQKALPHLESIIEKEMVVKEAHGDKGDLKLSAKDMVVKNLSKCKFIEAKRPKQLQISLVLDCPIDAAGTYKIGGKLLGLDIFGEGPFHITTEQMRVNVLINMAKDKAKDGHEYYKFGKYTFEYHPLQKVFFKLENLFDGDETRAAPVKDLIDTNWKELVIEFGGPIIDSVVHKAVKVMAKFCAAMTIEQFEKP